MRLSCITRAALVLAFIGAFGSLGQSLDGTGCIGSDPCISTWLDYQQRTFSIEAWNGTPDGIGLLNLLVGVGPNAGTTIQLPMMFNSYGEAHIVIPFDQLNNGADMAVGIQLFTMGADGSIVSSKVWGLTTHNYVVSDPSTQYCSNCPTTPGGWVEWIPWPGMASGPLYPHTWVAIPSGDERSSGQPMLALESGPAGSFPIN